MATKKATTGKKKAAVKQRASAVSGRDSAGRFAPGNDQTFKPGQSGNPEGRPKTRTLSEAYRSWLGLPMANDPTRTNADCVAEVIGQKALAGDVVAAKEICDRVEGKPRQALDITIEEKKRKMLENAIEMLMASEGIEREEAIEQLQAIAPEVGQIS